MRKYQCCYTYSVIAPVFNLEPYLDRFFESLAEQTADIASAVTVFCIDDGSTDESASIITAWQKRLPFVQCLRKKNGGRASARNFGLRHAFSDWVTFMDPDDYVSACYFEEVDRFLARPESAGTGMLSCRRLFYNEHMNAVRDTHYLRGQFAHGAQWLDASRDESFQEPSCSSVFYRRTMIAENKLWFKEDIRPFFEDTEFNIRYLLESGNQQVGILPAALYYYRVRSGVSSFIDSMKNYPEFYSELLENGYIRTLRSLQIRFGEIPALAGRHVLTALLAQAQYFSSSYGASYYRRFTDKKSLFKRIESALTLLGPEALTGGRCKVPGQLRSYLAERFTGRKVPVSHVDVHKYDAGKNQLKISYVSEDKIRFFQGESELVPAFHKRRRRNFCDDILVPEHIAWLQLKNREQPITVQAASGDWRFCRYGSELGRDFELCRHRPPGLHAVEKHQAVNGGLAGPDASPYGACWIFADSEDRADDNAEHLYWHVRERYPQIPSFFALREGCPDWRRMELRGARLLAFGSAGHVEALSRCRCLISSSGYARGREDSLLGLHGHTPAYYYVFLDHGVIKSDMSSSWPMNMDLFLTSTFGEYESIVGDDTPYPLTRKEVKLTGLPRFDALLRNRPESEKVVLVMPTWRSNLPVRLEAGSGAARDALEQVRRSDFFKHWQGFLRSAEAERIMNRHGYRMLFCPHPAIRSYLPLLDLPGHIAVYDSAMHGSMQNIFRQTGVFVTDYTSAAFDLALLGKYIIYYQFDAERHLDGNHNMTVPGYYSYERDGFGPVCASQAALCACLENACARSGMVESIYADRVNASFPFHDDEHCERVFREISALVEPDFTRC